MTTSPIHELLLRLVPLGRRAGHVAIDVVLEQYPAHELAAALYDWTNLWARPTQILPQAPWRTVLLQTGRGWGKTTTNVNFAIGEIASGRASRIALVAQSEAKCIEIFVHGASGFLAATPPWLGVSWEPSTNRLLFGNGASATAYTAQEPAGLRGPEHDLALATEIAAWPPTTRDEAMSNLRLGLRRGYGKLVADSTPRKRNPLMRQMLNEHAANPARHHIVRGSSDENVINLAPDVVAEWRAQWGGTAKGREEIDGEFLDDGEDQMFKSEWIERSRRVQPENVTRRVLSLDPAGTSGKRSDSTGIMDVALGPDQDIYVLGNLSGKHRAEVWPELVVSHYVRHACDLILAETNRGNDMIRAMLSGACKARGLTLIELGATEAPAGRAGVVYYRPYTSRGSKSARAGAAAGLVERGRVHFVVGKLGDLEERLCDFDGADGKPDDSVDAFAAAVVELAGLVSDKKDPRTGFVGIVAAQQALSTRAYDPNSRSITDALRGAGGWGGKI